MYRRPLLQRLDVQSVAVFRALQLGDMLCAVPALRALRASLPHARITLVGLPWAEQFAKRFACYVDEFVAFPGHPMLPEQTTRHDELAGFYADMCQRQLTLALQLHGSGDISNEIVHGFGARAMAGFGRGPAVHGQNTVLLPYPDAGTEPERLLSLVEQLGGTAVGSHLEFPLHRQDLRELEDSGVARGLEPGSYICVHPGARARDKCWPAQCFAQVGDQLAREFGLTVALTGAGSERALAQDVASQMESRAVNAAAPISIGAMAALMEGARLLVCNDTGVSHIAAGLKLKSVVIFSKADIARWAPLDRHNHRCIWDPDGERAAVVLQHARALLSGTGTGPERAVGMWPYW